MANELLRPNQYDIFAKKMTCDTIETTGSPEIVEVSGLCLATTVSNADTPGGTAANTVIVDNLILKYEITNGICTLFKKGDSGAFPGTYNANLAGTDRVFLLSKASGSPFAQGAIYIPPGTFPICDAENNDACLRTTTTFETALRQDNGGVSQTGRQTIITLFNFCTNSSNGQYGVIRIPRTYDYIRNDNITGIVTGTVTVSGNPETTSLQNGSLQTADITYTQQFFGGETNENSFPFFCVSYPVKY